MNDNIIISLHIHSQEVTPEQLNCIVAFASQFYRENKNKIEIVADKLPLRLNGKISQLTSNARRYFGNWNKAGTMRNIRIAERSGK